MKYLLLFSLPIVTAVQPAISAGKLGSVVAGSSSAIDAVTRDIKEWHDMEHPSCQMKKVLSAAVQRHDKEVSTEIWTVEGCDGKQFQYRVQVFPGQDGHGFSDSVGNADGSHLHIDGAR